jgi:hypothetical protein
MLAALSGRAWARLTRPLRGNAGGTQVALARWRAFCVARGRGAVPSRFRGTRAGAVPPRPASAPRLARSASDGASDRSPGSEVR